MTEAVDKQSARLSGSSAGSSTSSLDLNVGDVVDQADELEADDDAQPDCSRGIEARAATRRVKSKSVPAPSGVRLGHLNFPVLLMNLPLSLSAQIPNNAYMENMSPGEREVCLDRAIAQFLSLYKHIAQHAIVYLLPSTPGFQDQPYVSNLGAGFAPLRRGHRHYFEVPIHASRGRGEDWRRLLQVDELRRGAAS